MKVRVTFLEGDPDQPLVSGCLYHAEHQVPYDLPADLTRSVFKTLSTPRGGGYNELRIEDRRGAEQIYNPAMSRNEGNIDSLQSYDSEILTAGAMQKTINSSGSGEFLIQVFDFKVRHPQLYQSLFENCG